MRRLSLSVLIPAVLFVVLSGVQSILVWQNTNRRFDELVVNTQQSLTYISQQLQHSLKNSSESTGSLLDEKMLHLMIINQPIDEFVLFSNGQPILFSSHKQQVEDHKKKLSKTNFQRLQLAIQAKTSQWHQSPDRLTGSFYVPIICSTQNIKCQQNMVLYFHYDIHQTWLALKEHLYEIAFSQWALLLFAMVFLMLLLKFWLVKPLRRVIDQANHLEKYNVKGLPLKVHGEMNELNNLVTKISQSVNDSLAKARSDERRWQFALSGTGDGVWDWDFKTDKVTYNHQCCQMLDISADNMESNLDAWESKIYSEDREAALSELRLYLQGERPIFEHMHRIKRSNDVIWVVARGMIVEREDDRPVRMIAVLTNVTEVRNIQELLEYHSFYDEVTTLANRHKLLQELDDAIVDHRNRQVFGALIYIDVDHFKNVNDLFGHHLGDAILKLVAKRLLAQCQKHHLVARLSGDEFAILLRELGARRSEATRQALAIANQLRAKLKESFDIGGNEVDLTVTTGIALFPYRQSSAYEIFRQADIALYYGKESGRSGIHFFIEEMAHKVYKRHELQLLMRKAIANDDMVLYYQPRFNDDYQMVGAETLLRWFDEQRGWISPGHFIPLAEESGFIVTLGSWVMRLACRALKRWQNQGIPEQFKTLSVNVSPKQFHRSRFVQDTIAIIEEEGCDPRLLELEITEGVLVTNIDETIRKLEQLRQYGVRFSVDDFGTGYSSLAYLNRLPINCLKIDKSFVDEVQSSHSRSSIITTIIAMSENLGLEVVAEGVETEYQMQFLKYRGCHVYQGFLFSEALEPELFENLLFRNS